MFRIYVRGLSLFCFAFATYWALALYREPMRYMSCASMTILTASGDTVSEIQQQQVLAWALSHSLRMRAYQRMADQGDGLLPPDVEFNGLCKPDGGIILGADSADQTKTRTIVTCLVDEIRATSADMPAPTSNPFRNSLTFRITERPLLGICIPKVVAVPLMIRSGLPFLAGALLMFVSYRLPRRAPPLPRS